MTNYSNRTVGAVIVLSDNEREFMGFLKKWKFKTTIKHRETVASKFLGITYKTVINHSTETVHYNDFSLSDKLGDGLLISSGRNGSYRPEGYAFGSAESSKRIKERLETIVSSFNELSGDSLTVSDEMVICGLNK